MENKNKILILVGFLVVCVFAFLGLVFMEKELPHYKPPEGYPQVVIKPEKVPSDKSLALWNDFKAKYGEKLEIKWSGYTGAPHEIYGTIHIRSTNRTGATSKEIADNIARSFISENKDLLKVKISDLKLSRVLEGKTIVVEYQQYYQNIPVYDKEVRVVISKATGDIYVVTNTFYPNINISTTPKISKEEAVEIAGVVLKKILERCSDKDIISTLRLKILFLLKPYISEPEEVNFMILPVVRNESINYFLIWEVRASRGVFGRYVDAMTGDIIDEEGNMMLPETFALRIEPLQNFC